MFITILAEKEPSGRALCFNKSCMLQQFGDSFTSFSRFVSVNDCFMPCCKEKQMSGVYRCSQKQLERLCSDLKE